MATKVGAWDCPYCGAKGNPGYEYECSGCEHPRPLGIKFYLPENAPYATPEQKAKMGSDPNWYCAYCQSGNRSSETKCWKCGAARGSDSVQHVTRVYRGNDIPRSAEEAAAMEKSVSAEPQERSVSRNDDPYNPPIADYKSPYQNQSPVVGGLGALEDNRRKWFVTSGAILGILAVLFCVYFFFIRTTEHTAVVSGFSWSQNVVIEEYQTHHKEGWSIPVGGRETGSTIRQSGTVKVHDGYHYETVSDTCYRSVTVDRTCTSDDGNGGFSEYSCSYTSSEPYSCTKQEEVEDYHYDPVYSLWYSYDVDEWTAISDHPTSGNDHKPYFDPAQPVGNLQRRIEQQGTYTVHFACDGLNPFDRTYDLATWQTFDYQQQHKIEVNALKVILEVK